MRNRILPALALFAVLSAPTLAHATFRWQHYNVDPFAPTREEAMEKREKVFAQAGLSKACVAAAMQATSEPGHPGNLKNGNRVDWMASGHHFDRDVLVDLERVDRGVEPLIVTEEWEVSCDGRKYVIILPQTCNNWSGRLIVVPKPVPRPRRHVRYRPRPALPTAYAAPPPVVQSDYPYPAFPAVVCIPRGAIRCPN